MNEHAAGTNYRAATRVIHVFHCFHSRRALRLDTLSHLCCAEYLRTVVRHRKLLIANSVMLQPCCTLFLWICKAEGPLTY